MQADLPIQAVVAIATVVASLIAGALSFVNLTLTKELKTSEFRQSWIDALREDLASYFAATRAFANAIAVAKKLGPAYKQVAVLPMPDEKLGELRHEAADAYYRIKLRLNADEAEHVELLRLIDRTVDEQNKLLQAAVANPKDTLTAVDAASSYARPVLKAEWNRVKKGELAFRVARNWAAPAVMLLSVLFVVFVWTGKFKI